MKLKFEVRIREKLFYFKIICNTQNFNLEKSTINLQQEKNFHKFIGIKILPSNLETRAYNEEIYVSKKLSFVSAIN